MSSDRVPAAPGVLVWARTSAGLTPELAAKRLAVSETTLSRWEAGEQAPTIKQLRKAGRLYRRPLAVLLLPEPPMDFQPLKDFRRFAGEAQPPLSPSLLAEFKRAVSQREVFLELADLAPSSVEATEPLVVSDASTEDAAAELRMAIGLDRRAPNWAQANPALSHCIARVERLGVLVIQTKGVETNEMRGFSISEWPFPVIALNGSDWPRPRLFTLIHELCHLVLNAGGLCDLHETRAHRRDEDNVEHFCNQVAAAVFMPRATLLADPAVARFGADHEWTLDELRQLSQRYGPSSESVLLRLVSLDRATWDLYWTRKPELEAAYEQARREERERQKQAEGGPSFYVIKARDLGHGYVTSVLEAYDSRAITSLDVADYLDVRYDQLPKLQKAVLG